MPRQPVAGPSRGTPEPAGKSAGIKEVARRAGVSIGTVSNVLNRPAVVATETRERVLAAIDQLGYVRNDSARQLRAGQSRVIAMVVLGLANPFFADVVSGAEAVAEEHDMIVLVCNSGEDEKRERRHLEHMEEQRVQGVLIMPISTAVDDLLERLIARGTPVVLVDRGSGRHHRCSVAVDDQLGGRLVGRHLAAQGHRRIAFIGGPLNIQQVSDRHEGIAAALADVPEAKLSLLVTSGLTAAAGRQAAAELVGLPESRRPTAIFCANDLVAFGVLQTVTLRGLRVPEDIAIVGYDDIDFAAAAAVPLSSVRQPREQLGRTAAQLLLEESRLGATHQHRHVVFQPELIIRDSSGLNRGDLPRAAPATEA